VRPRRRRISGTVYPIIMPLLEPVPFCGQGFGHNEPSVRGHRQGDVGIPGPPVPDLVLIETGGVLGLLEKFLDGPAGAGNGGQVE
jgi:hypothetical protein